MTFDEWAEKQDYAIGHDFARAAWDASAEYWQRMYDDAAARLVTAEGVRWIPVGERLPEESGYRGHVLVARLLPYDPQFGDRDVTMAWHSKTGWRSDHGSVEQHDAIVTHWRPLPPPPAGEGDGGKGGKP